jgi:hypothetical protein
MEEIDLTNPPPFDQALAEYRRTHPNDTRTAAELVEDGALFAVD